jgi:hypothetical protein
MGNGELDFGRPSWMPPDDVLPVIMPAGRFLIRAAQVIVAPGLIDTDKGVSAAEAGMKGPGEQTTQICANHCSRRRTQVGRRSIGGCLEPSLSMPRLTRMSAALTCS